MKNNYWIRHFLICDKMAKSSCEKLGWQVDNFAKSILEEQDGRIGNEQMNRFFGLPMKLLQIFQPVMQALCLIR